MFSDIYLIDCWSEIVKNMAKTCVGNMVLLKCVIY